MAAKFESLNLKIFSQQNNFSSIKTNEWISSKLLSSSWTCSHNENANDYLIVYIFFKFFCLYLCFQMLWKFWKHIERVFLSQTDQMFWSRDLSQIMEFSAGGCSASCHVLHWSVYICIQFMYSIITMQELPEPIEA